MMFDVMYFGFVLKVGLENERRENRRFVRDLSLEKAAYEISRPSMSFN